MPSRTLLHRLPWASKRIDARGKPCTAHPRHHSQASRSTSQRKSWRRGVNSIAVCFASESMLARFLMLNTFGPNFRCTSLVCAHPLVRVLYDRRRISELPLTVTEIDAIQYANLRAWATHESNRRCRLCYLLGSSVSTTVQLFVHADFWRIYPTALKRQKSDNVSNDYSLWQLRERHHETKCPKVQMTS